MTLKKEPKSPETVTETVVIYWTGGSYTKGPGATPHHVGADAGQDMTTVFATQGRRRPPFIGGIDVRWAHQLPGAN